MNIQHFGASVLVATLLTAGCAAAPGAAPTAAPDVVRPAMLDPVGTFNFSSQMGGGNFDGVIRITRQEGGAYTGTVSTPVTGELPVKGVDVQGERIRVTASGRHGDAVINLHRSGRDLTGNWAYAGETGVLTGRHVSTLVTQSPENLPTTAEERARYVGNYDISGVKLQVRIFEENDRLMARPVGQRAFPLFRKGEHRFHAPASLGVVVFDFAVENGRATGFALQQHGKTFPATRIQ